MVWVMCSTKSLHFTAFWFWHFWAVSPKCRGPIAYEALFLLSFWVVECISRSRNWGIDPSASCKCMIPRYALVSMEQGFCVIVVSVRRPRIVFLQPWQPRLLSTINDNHHSWFRYHTVDCNVFFQINHLHSTSEPWALWFGVRVVQVSAHIYETALASNLGTRLNLTAASSASSAYSASFFSRPLIRAIWCTQVELLPILSTSLECSMTNSPSHCLRS